MVDIERSATGLYFEELEVGHQVRSPGRTITETDIVTFAGLSGDYNQLHTNAEYSRTASFGQRVAHGLLGLAVASGLVSRLGLIEGTAEAFASINWKFTAPIYIGDTISVVATVSKTRALPRGNGGLVVMDLKMVNQKGETVQKGEWSVIVKGRPT